MPLAGEVEAYALIGLGRRDEARRLIGDLGAAAREGRYSPAGAEGLQLALQIEEALEFGDLDRARRTLDRILAREPDQGTFAAMKVALRSFGRRDQEPEARRIVEAFEAAFGAPYFDYVSLMLDQSPEVRLVRREPWVEELLPELREKYRRALPVVETARAQGEIPAFLEQPLEEFLANVAEAEDALAGS